MNVVESNNWYRTGGGRQAINDATNLTIRLTTKVPAIGGLAVGRVQGVGDYLVHGQVTLERIKEDKYKINTEKYDFDMKRGSSLSVFVRNVETIIGLMVAGKGDTFNMVYIGSPRVIP
jgi:hypothetical protein